MFKSKGTGGIMRTLFACLLAYLMTVSVLPAQAIAETTGDDSQLEGLAGGLAEDSADEEELVEPEASGNNAEDDSMVVDEQLTVEREVAEPEVEDVVTEDAPVVEEDAADGEEDESDVDSATSDDETNDSVEDADMVEDGGEQLGLSPNAGAGSSMGKAKKISLGKTTRGALSSDDDVDWYAISLSKPGKLSVTFGADAVDEAGYGWEILLYDENSNIIDREECKAQIIKAQTIIVTGLPSGTYSFCVRSLYRPSHLIGVEYRLTPTFKASSLWETELNDERSSADRISFGKKYSAALSRDSDVDWFTFTTTKAGKFSLDFSAAPAEAENTSWDVFLYDDADSVICSYSYYAGATKSKTIMVTGLPAGTYYMRVASSGWSTDKLRDVVYTIAPSFKASSVWEIEFNDTMRTSETLALGKTRYGTLSNSTNNTMYMFGDEDYWSFTLSKAGTVQITFGAEYDGNGSSQGWVVSLQNDDGEKLASETYPAESTKVKTLYTVDLPAGTYYIFVCGTNRYYSGDLGGVVYKLTVKGQQKDIGSVDVSSVRNKSFTGKALKPKLTLKDGSKTLKEGTDYTVSYKNNTMPGTATITVKGKGSYIGTRTVTFKITEPFSDVGSKTPHYADILWLYGSGVTQGWEMPNGSREFRPYGDVARCDMAAFLYRLAGSPKYTPTAKDRKYFSDVDSSTPHAKEIWWLASKGISRGWTESDDSHTFRPYDTVARCDMAAFLYRLAGSPKYAPSAAERRYFRDIDSSSPHAKEVWWLASTGISKGWDEGGGRHTFRPYENVARCDMAAFLHRMDQGAW